MAATMAWLRYRAPLGADEGYLWYGTQRQLQGEWPHRDFKSYEPGRYFWCGLFARMIGPGLASVRMATHAFLALALSLALMQMRVLGLGWQEVGAIALLLALWALPQHKQFEHGCLLLAWAACSGWLVAPSPVTAAVAGASVGVSAVFGFNLALYVAGALLLAVTAMLFTATLGVGGFRFEWMLPGILAGMLPFLVMLTDRRFARAFRERRIASVLRRGSSNLPLPCPWPGRALPPAFQIPARSQAWRTMFLALLVVPPVALLAALLAPAGERSIALIVAASLAATASHHALARCDPAHLAQAAGPMWLSIALLASSGLAPAMSTTVLVILCMASAWLLWPQLVQGRGKPATLKRLIGGLQISVDPATAGILDALTGHRDPTRDSWLFAAPAWPALYAILGLRAPAYDTFCLYPADALAQRAMFDQLRSAQVNVAVVDNGPVDGREELRFSRTHPRVWEMLCETFDRQELRQAGQDVVMFTRRT